MLVVAILQQTASAAFRSPNCVHERRSANQKAYARKSQHTNDAHRFEVESANARRLGIADCTRLTILQHVGRHSIYLLGPKNSPATARPQRDRLQATGFLRASILGCCSPSSAMLTRSTVAASASIGRCSGIVRRTTENARRVEKTAAEKKAENKKRRDSPKTRSSRQMSANELSRRRFYTNVGASSRTKREKSANLAVAIFAATGGGGSRRSLALCAADSRRFLRSRAATQAMVGGYSFGRWPLSSPPPSSSSLSSSFIDNKKSGDISHAVSASSRATQRSAIVASGGALRARARARR